MKTDYKPGDKIIIIGEYWADLRDPIRKPGAVFTVKYNQGEFAMLSGHPNGWELYTEEGVGMDYKHVTLLTKLHKALG